MKTLRLSKKQIVLAINAAVLALFLSAGHANAQFVYNGQAGLDRVAVRSASGSSNTVGGSGTFSGSFLDGGLGKNTVTIASGADITNTTSGSVLEFGLGGSGGGTINNQGTLSETEPGGTNAAVDIGTGSALLALTNAGTISSGNGASCYGVEAKATGLGAISINNTTHGVIEAAGSGTTTGMVVTGNGGLVTIENNGAISGSGTYYNPATGLVASNTGGSISITNASSLSASGYGYDNGAVGLSASIAGAGNLTVNNPGLLGTTAAGFYGTAEGATLHTASGDITVTNTGGISASAYQGRGMDANAGGSLTVNNSGSISGSAPYYEGTEGFGPISDVGLSAAAVKNVSITNSGSVRGTASTYSSYGNAEGISAYCSGGGVYVNSTNSVSSGNSLFGNCIALYAADNASASITVLNSASVSADAVVGNAFGVYVATGGTTPSTGTATITNTGAISASSFYSTVGIEVITSVLRAQVTNGTGGSISAEGSGIGIQIQSTVGSDVIVNQGTISSSGPGIEDLGTGNITVKSEGGSISAGGGNPAIKLGSGNNQVTVALTSTISGVIDGGKTHTDNTLTFTGNGATPAQLTALRTVAAEAAASPTGTYSVTLGSETYTFTDFNLVKATH